MKTMHPYPYGVDLILFWRDFASVHRSPQSGNSKAFLKGNFWSKAFVSRNAVIVSTRPSNCSDVVRFADRQPFHTQDVVRGGGVKIEIGLGKTQQDRSEEHTSELQSLMRLSYAVFCLHKK